MTAEMSQHVSESPRPLEPLVRIEPGWLFLVAGLALLVCTVLIPPADDLARLRHQKDRLAAQDQAVTNVLGAYVAFMDAIDQQDPDLIRRLAVTHRNLVPEGAVLLDAPAEGVAASVDRWILATAPPPPSVGEFKLKDSWLRRLCDGPNRLWTIGAGIVAVFIGLLPARRHD